MDQTLLQSQVMEISWVLVVTAVVEDTEEILALFQHSNRLIKIERMLIKGHQGLEHLVQLLIR